MVTSLINNLLEGFYFVYFVKTKGHYIIDILHFWTTLPGLCSFLLNIVPFSFLLPFIDGAAAAIIIFEMEKIFIFVQEGVI